MSSNFNRNFFNQRGDRGVMAHKLFGAFPVGFIILFSRLRVTSVQHRRDLQACYQVSLNGGKCLLTHTVEMPPHELAQIVKHPVCHDTDSNIDPLLHYNKQSIAVAHCCLKRSKNPISAKNIKDFPVYLKITKSVPKGFEILIITELGIV